MAVTIALPEPIEQQLRRAWGNLDRKALEVLAIEGYRAEALSAGQVAELLGLSVIETEAFLKERGIDLRLTIEDFDLIFVPKLCEMHQFSGDLPHHSHPQLKRAGRWRIGIVCQLLRL